MNWGSDPDVALFIGGLKDGDIEDIGGVNFQVETDTVDVYAGMQVLTYPTQRWSYVRGKVKLGSGYVVTVMYDNQMDMMSVIRRAENEWVSLHAYPQRWMTGGIVTAAPPNHIHWAQPSGQQIYQNMLDYLDPPKKKSPEEALAWLNQTEGKDFL